MSDLRAASFALAAAALLLAGCADHSAPPGRIAALKLESFTDDVDCNGTVDLYVEVGAVGENGTRVAFEGVVHATLFAKALDGPESAVATYEKRSDDATAYDGRSVVWWIDGKDLDRAHSYRLAVKADVAGGRTLEATTDLDAPGFLAAAAGPAGTC